MIGYHPTEVVTLKAARDALAATRVVRYQPHRFTRTRDHFDEFVSVLSENQVLILLMSAPRVNRRLMARIRRRWRTRFDPVVWWSPSLYRTGDLAAVLMSVLKTAIFC